MIKSQPSITTNHNHNNQPQSITTINHNDQSITINHMTLEIPLAEMPPDAREVLVRKGNGSVAFGCDGCCMLCRVVCLVCRVSFLVYIRCVNVFVDASV